jgi:hypothetical protein
MLLSFAVAGRDPKQERYALRKRRAANMAHERWYVPQIECDA